MLDPGPDFAKTPAQTVAVLRRLDALRALGRPMLLAVSRKDFVGAITGGAPRERARRDAGGASATGSTRARTILRVHDVAAAADFLARARRAARRARARGRSEGLTPRPLPLTDRKASCRPLSTTRPGANRPPTFKGVAPCPPSWTAPRWSRARSPTCTCSPTSSASTASAACARPTWSTRSSPARPATPSPSSPPSRRAVEAAEAAERRRAPPRSPPTTTTRPRRSRRGRRGGRGRGRGREEGGATDDATTGEEPRAEPRAEDQRRRGRRRAAGQRLRLPAPRAAGADRRRRLHLRRPGQALRARLGRPHRRPGARRRAARSASRR